MTEQRILNPEAVGVRPCPVWGALAAEYIASENGGFEHSDGLDEDHPDEEMMNHNHTLNEVKQWHAEGSIDEMILDRIKDV